MPIALLVVGSAALLIGGILLLIASFRESILWGLANLFVPFAAFVFACVHWRAARAAVLWAAVGFGMIGAGLASSSAVREMLHAVKAGESPSFLGILGKEPPKPEDVSPGTVDQQRLQIEQMEARFQAECAVVAQQHKALTARRASLGPGDVAAVEAFNAEAELYQQANRRTKELRAEIDLARANLERLLDVRSRQAAAAGPGGQSSIVIYTTSRCGWCDRAKEYFAQKGVRYEERNVDKSEAARAEFQKLGGRGVPLILVGNERMDGFDEQRLNQLL